MKKFFHKFSLVFALLLGASVFAVPIVRGFLYEDERIAAIIALVILVLLVLMAVIGIRRHSKIRQRATAQTSGVVRDVRVSLFGDEYDSDSSCRFRISYQVDGREYRISEHGRVADRQAAKKWIGKTVAVHYAPENPKTAWAEVPRKA